MPKRRRRSYLGYDPGMLPSERARHALKAVQASYRFGHRKPTASAIGTKYGLSDKRAQEIIDSVYGTSRSSAGDNMITPTERAQLQAKAFGGPIPVQGRGSARVPLVGLRMFGFPYY